VWLIYPGHCTPISVKIGQHLVKLYTKVLWCFYAPQWILRFTAWRGSTSSGCFLYYFQRLCVLLVWCRYYR